MKLGGLDVTAIKLGALGVAKVMLGATEVWSATPTPPPAGYRYWRLNITANNGRGTTQVAEVELRATVSGANIATGGTPSASSEFSFLFDAAKAFDNNTSNYWSTATSVVAAWLRYDLGVGNASVVAQYAIRARSDANNGTPSAWTLEGSEDGSVWTVVDTQSGQTGWANGEQRVFTV